MNTKRFSLLLWGVLLLPLANTASAQSPTEKTLAGDVYVCKNQSDVRYSLVETEENIAYQWFISGGEITDSPNPTQIVVYWDNTETGALTLLQTNIASGCQLNTIYHIEKSETAAPGKTRISKKHNSNMLICEENSPNIIYEWGFIDLQTGTREIIPESNDRYIQLPHSFDTAKYDYFVVTTFLSGKDKSCSTTTFYGEIANALPQQTPNKAGLTVYPNPAKNHFIVGLHGKEISNFTVSINSLLGERMFTRQHSGYSQKIPFDLHLPKGTYLINIQTEREVMTQKIVIE
jgi:hypothetical protein